MKVRKMENKIYDIDAVIKNEKQRYLNIKSQYEQQLLSYPRGSLVIRESNGRKYCYFKYRDGKKVITKYAGTILKFNELNAQILERDRLIKEIKLLTTEIERIEKMESIKQN